jgi:uncharacterized protein YfaS (alpha-2-macroglobulin family)
MQNNSKTALGFILGLALFLAAGWAGYAFYPSSSEHRLSNAGKAAEVKIEPGRNDEDVDRAINNATEQTSTDDTEADRLSSFVYDKWYEVEGANSQVKACFAFSEPVAKTQDSELRPFIDISPDAKVAISVEGRALCLGGLSFNQDYRVTLRQGLPSEKADKTLAANQTVSIGFGDKPAFVGFTDNGIILPKTDRGGLAIETVNIEALDIIVERVNHRILSQTNPNSGGQALEGDYSYNYDAWQEKVEVWSGRLDIVNRRNKTVRTIFPLQDITADLSYGAYIVTAIRGSDKENKARVAKAWRWIISTDMALTSYRGADFTHVNVRSLKTAKLVPNIRLELIAQNNDLLAQAETDAQGRAKFPAALFNGQGNTAPKMILAYGPENDFAMLDLSRSPLDMTAYDVEGRRAQSPIDIFAYTERGIYRPGETVHLTALLRDDKGRAHFDRPVQLTLTKPDGGVALRETYETSDKAGSLILNYELPNGAPRGVWTLSLKPEGLDVAKSVRFDVQDFVPQKLKVTTKLDEETLLGDSRATLSVQADFLYGAPGQDLDSEAEARVQIQNQPFANYKTYRFGDTRETFEERLIEIGVGVTDEKGALEFPISLKAQNIRSSYPLRLMVTSAVAEPGGRYVQKTNYVPLRTQDSYIGFKPNFEGRYASHKSPVGLNIVHLNAQGTLMSGDVDWRLFEEIHDFQWYRENGRWRYRKDVSEVALANGTLSLDNAPAQWSRTLPRGQYRLEALSPTGEKGAIRFNVGWARPGNGSDAPDRIVMGKVEETVKGGDTITLSVNAPYAGRGDLVIANESVQSIQSVVLPEGESELTLKFNKSWGDSVYAMLTLYTPEDSRGAAIQRRAAGLSYIALDRSDQVLDVTFNAPDVIQPSQTLDLPVSVSGLSGNETAWINIAAVDEGILQLTQYDAPDAAAYFFGKKAFGLDIRDDYSRLLNPNLGVAAILPQGGDSVGGAGLSVIPEKTVSLYSGPIRLKNGKATASFVIPDFQGRLRLMATAWSDKSVGSGEGELVVRDPVPIIVGLPRFLAPGDKAMATVSVDNLDGPEGVYQLSLNSDLAAQDNQTTFDLIRNARKDVGFSIVSNDLGVSDVDIRLTAQNDFALSKSLQIETRSPFRPRTEKRLTRLAPGEGYSLSAERLSGFIPAATDVSVSVSNLPGLNAQSYIKSLSAYPYGCTEQTTSRAMPLLFVSELGGLKDLSEPQRAARVDLAIKRLVARQDGQGAFGLWRVGDSNSSPWLQLYVTEFLILAEARGQSVPKDALEKAISAAQKLADPNRYSSLDLDYNYGWSNSRGLSNDTRRYERAAYAHYVLSLADKTDVPDLRYLADNQAKEIKDPLALAYLATALSRIDDQRRASVLFTQSLANLKSGTPNKDDYYASGLRNAAAILAVANDYLPDEQAGDLLGYIGASVQEGDYLNTQEQAYLVRMIAALDASNDPISVQSEDLNFVTSKLSQTADIIGSKIGGGKNFTNMGEQTVWVSEMIRGLPDTDPGEVSEGYALKKEMFSMTGELLPLTSLTKGDRAIIRVTIDPSQNRSAMVVLADLLPAGLEIESILTEAETKPDSLYDFVGKIRDLDLAEARDDRVVVSERLSRWDSSDLVVAYIVRAVTEGDFIFPGAVAEDMYRPDIRGRTQATRLRVSGSGSL